MIHIGVDGNEANVESRVGVSVYAYELLSFFNKKCNQNLIFSVYLKESPKSHMPKENKYFKYRVVNGKFGWSQIFLPFDLYLRRGIDVFFSPAHYIPRFCPVPTVVTLHDLGYIFYPNEFLQKDLYKLNNWTRHATNSSTHVICVSENTAKDARKYYNIPGKKLSVISNGFRVSLETTGHDSRLPENIHKPYLLTVGTLQPRKNIPKLLKAFSILREKDTSYQLVIVGKKGWLYDDVFNMVQDLKLDTSVLFTGFVDDSALKSLYKHASLVVLPGLYEGFGYPMLEAMYFNCPVVASNTGALSEIGASAALYFDPQDEDEIAKVIHKVISNATIRKELIARGRQQVKKYTWSKCGQETLDVLTQATKSR